MSVRVRPQVQNINKRGKSNVSRQDISMQGMWSRIRIHSRRTGILCRERLKATALQKLAEIQERTAEELKELCTRLHASCGKVAKVPFKPREDRPVYCSECFAKMKQE